MKLYVAGPMRGYPQFNFPAFDQATKELRSLGHLVFSPAEQDRLKYGESFAQSVVDGIESEVPEFDLRNALALDLSWICQCAEAVVTLDGWEASRGATAEVAAARALLIPVYGLREFMEL